MAHFKYDNVAQIATGTGAGALTLGAAASEDRQTLQSAGMLDTNTAFVRIQHATILSEWENVKITFSSGGSGSITRTFDSRASSATGSLINFSAGNKIVSNVLRAKDAIVLDDVGLANVPGNLYVTGYGIIAGILSADALLAGDLEISGTGAFGSTLGVTGVATFQTNMRFPVGSTLNVGPSATSAHQAGNVGSITFGFSDGGGFSGMKVSNIHNGTYSSQEIEFQQSQGGVYAAATKLKVTSTGHVTPGADNAQDFGIVGTKWRNGYFSTNVIVGNVFLQGDGTHGYLRTTVGNLYLGPPGVNAWYITATGNHLLPVVGSTYNIGSASLPINNGWTANAWTVTSSFEVKMLDREAGAAEKRAAARIKARGPTVYKLKESVSAKGAAARLHVGYIAEWVRDDIAAEGLDPWAYGFLCSDPLIKTETYFETATRPKVAKVSAVENVIEIIAGRPVMVRKEVEHDAPAGEFMTVRDEAGQIVMQKVGEEPTGEVEPVLDGAGDPVMVRVIGEEDGKPVIVQAARTRPVMRAVMEPLTYFVPEMEEYQIERTREVDTGEVRLGLRYSELEAFLRCAD